MAKRERKKATKNVNPVLYIYTEGKQTEINYIRGYIRDYLNEKGYLGKDIFITQPSNYLPYGLYEFAKGRQERFPNDIYWLVFDCDEHPKKDKVFNSVANNNIQVAYSSICFEMWILLHFQYSTTAYSSCASIKKALNPYFNGNYEKSLNNLFDISAVQNNDGLNKAKANATKLCDYVLVHNPQTPIWKLNPYTNVHKLLEAIDDFIEKKDRL